MILVTTTLLVRFLFHFQMNLRCIFSNRNQYFICSDCLFYLEILTFAFLHSLLSDPLFTGFKPLPDEHIIPVEDLLRSRRKYFKEGTSVANNLMSTYTGERRMYYTDKLDTKETMRMGFAFFVGTCILDFIICVM